MSDRVPSYVHFPEMAVPTDEEPRPVTWCPDCDASLLGPGSIRHLGPEYHEWSPARPARDRSRLLVVAVFLALALLVVVAWRTGR